MAINKAKKVEILEKLKLALKSAQSLVFVNFHRLKVSDTSEMRRALKGDGISYTVAKKTLVRRALDDAKFDGSVPEMEGELAIAWGEDIIAPARGVHVFQRKFPESIKILGGIFQGRFMSKLEMEEIALIPSLEALRGKFVNIINSPIQRVTIALGQIAKSRS